jgi:hypothetical protein
VSFRRNKTKRYYEKERKKKSTQYDLRLFLILKIKLSGIARRNRKKQTIRFKILSDTVEFQCHLKRKKRKKTKFFHSDSLFSLGFLHEFRVSNFSISLFFHFAAPLGPTHIGCRVLCSSSFWPFAPRVLRWQGMISSTMTAMALQIRFVVIGWPAGTDGRDKSPPVVSPLLTT